MHLWMTYTVLPENGKSFMPELLEKRNVFWTEETKRTVNAKSIVEKEEWIPAQAKSLQMPSMAADLNLSFTGGGYKVSVRPTPDDFKTQPNLGKIAVLIDASYSMTNKREDLKEAIPWLRDQHAGKMDVFAKPYGNALEKLSNDADISKILFFGGQLNSALWNEAVAIHNQENYDAVFILSDQGNYEPASDNTELQDTSKPVLFVHLGALSPAYEDKILKKIMSSKNDVATDIKDAYRKFIQKIKMTEKQRIAGFYLWTFEPLENAGNNIANVSAKEQKGPLAALAAKHLIDMKSSENNTMDITQLDLLHNVAKQYEIVTPYSSMIVLVNDRQKEALKAAEQEHDRFNRTVEKGVETLSKPTNPMVTATPEPEVWILLILSSLLLFIFIKKKREVLIVKL